MFTIFRLEAKDFSSSIEKSPRWFQVSLIDKINQGFQVQECSVIAGIFGR